MITVMEYDSVINLKTRKLDLFFHISFTKEKNGNGIEFSDY